MAPVLTARFVESAKPDGKRRREFADGALPGFYLVVQPSGAKSWAVRFRIGKKPAKLTLGPYPLLDLAAARELGRAALRTVAEGGNPIEQRALAGQQLRAAANRRFGAVVTDFIDRYAKPRTRTWPETQRVLSGRDVAGWCEKDIVTITRAEVIGVLDSIIQRGSPIQANRVLAALRRLFSWAVERGLIESSPAAGIRAPSRESARDRVLSDRELATIWSCAEQVGFPFGSAVQLLILTGQRRSEVLESEWSEFDFESATWSIPRDRSKSDRAHVVPLSPLCLSLLKSLPRLAQPGSVVFTTNGASPFSGVSRALKVLQDRVSYALPSSEATRSWRLHDIRRTFASGCARLGVPLYVIERCLNHSSGTFSGVVGVYQRHEFLEERRAALGRWAEHLQEITTRSQS